MTNVKVNIEKCIKIDTYEVSITHQNGLISKELLEFNPNSIPSKELKPGDKIICNYWDKPDRIRVTTWYKLKE